MRNNQIKEAQLGQLTGMQVGYACVFALVFFTAIIGALSYFVAKLMS